MKSTQQAGFGGTECIRHQLVVREVDWVGDFGSMLPSQQQTHTFPLVAQIDFPSAGITEGEDPMNSTKLARRDVVWISN
jgi:hypothetical protein